MTVSRWSATAASSAAVSARAAPSVHLNRQLGVLGAEIIETGLEVREPVLAAFG